MNDFLCELQKDENLKSDETDYIGDDGLLHCGKCKGQKQVRLAASALTTNKKLIVSCLCECQAEKNRRTKELNEQRMVESQIRLLKEKSLMEGKLREARFSLFQRNDYNQKAYALAKKYVERFDEMCEKHQGILFWGAVGTGKSYTAACIANELIQRLVPVVMTSFTRLLQEIQYDFEKEKSFMGMANKVDLLIIDDLGAERDTNYALEKVYNVIDNRYQSGKPLILTSNMTLREMQETTEARRKRIYDRVFEMCFPVRMTGRSWREREAEKRFDTMKTWI